MEEKRGGGRGSEPSRNENENGDLGLFHAEDNTGEHLGLVHAHHVKKLELMEHKAHALGSKVLELVVEGIEADGEVHTAGGEHVVHAKINLWQGAQKKTPHYRLRAPSVPRWLRDAPRAG